MLRFPSAPFATAGHFPDLASFSSNQGEEALEASDRPAAALYSAPSSLQQPALHRTFLMAKRVVPANLPLCQRKCRNGVLISPQCGRRTDTRCSGCRQNTGANGGGHAYQAAKPNVNGSAALT